MDSIMESEVAAEPLEPAVRAFVKPTTLNGLLQALLMIDEEFLEIDFDQQIDLLESGKVKIDNYKYLLDKMKLMAEDFGRKEAEFKRARRTMEANAERLEEHLIFAMQSNKFHEFTGHQYKAKIRYHDFVSLKSSEPADYHAIQFSEFIRVKREWKKADIKKALQSEKCPDGLRELASIERSAKVTFSVIKDI